MVGKGHRIAFYQVEVPRELAPRLCLERAYPEKFFPNLELVGRDGDLLFQFAGARARISSIAICSTSDFSSLRNTSRIKPTSSMMPPTRKKTRATGNASGPAINAAAAPPLTMVAIAVSE